MSATQNSQFTLRDLVVATVIIGLICLLVPSCLAGGHPGGTSRRNTCQSNQHNISLAVLQYAEAKRHFPGYANRLGRMTTTYILPILPYMEKNDIYNVWSKSEGSEAPTEGTVYMSILVCPSSPPAANSIAPNTYVINAGRADLPDDAPAELIEAGGLAVDLTETNPVLMSPKYVEQHDGAAFTLLTTENLQSGSWALTDPSKLYAQTTFLWWNHPPKNTKDYRINQGRTPVGPRSDIIYSRPSSNHPGGVVVSFCGGNVRFLAEDIDYDVYKQLMTPNGAASGDEKNLDITESDF